MLRQNCVVGIGTGAGHLINGLIHRQSPVRKQADQLRDDHRGVGVVDLDDHMIRELTGRKAPFLQFRQYELAPADTMKYCW